MNFKKLAFWTTLFTTAAVPLATAQNPVILQGNYVSNVFGQSNFVLNPNAQTNLSNTSTTAGISLSRSTTTPLVATSEFTLSTTSFGAGVHATWTLRAFDQGMKGQNCEARFSYRGFATATTKAELVQNSLVVASLTLTPSTDPRIASINFPCGDLTNLTTFRIAQTTANMTGTNEIGGIYVGLATNQANVAQAELIGTLRNYGANCIWTGANTSAIAADTDCSNYTKEGLDLAPTTRVPAITFTATKSGNHLIGVSGYIGLSALSVGQCNVYQNGTLKNNLFAVYTSTGATSNEMRQSVQFNAELVAGTAYTFDVRCATSMLVISRSVEESLYWTVYRFPTSSELVVTPERQNTFGGVAWSGNIDISTIGATTNTIINTTNFGTPIPFGKATIASTSCGLTANDVGVCFENVPPGTYEVTTSFEQGAVYSFGTAGATACSARIHVSGTSFSDTSVASAFTEVGAAGQVDWVTLSSGVVTISSFQPKLALVLKQSKSGGNGRCLIRSSANGTTYPAKPTITFKPLDQPSNSALYVEGPVKASATGAAISSGYVGEMRANENDSCGTSAIYSDGASITLTPGVWIVNIHAQLNVGAAASVTDFLAWIGPQSGNVTTWRVSGVNDAWLSALTFAKMNITPPTALIRYDGTNFYRLRNNVWSDAYASASGILYAKKYRDSTACTWLTTTLTATRVN